MLLVLDSASPGQAEAFGRRLVELSNETTLHGPLDGDLKETIEQVKSAAGWRNGPVVFAGSWLGKPDAWDYEWQVGRAFDSVGMKLWIREGYVQDPSWRWRLTPNPGHILGELGKMANRPSPEGYVGPPGASVLVLGSRPRGGITKATITHDRWLPFSSSLGTRLGRCLGDDALRVGWGYHEDLEPEILDSATTIFAFGRKAEAYAKALGHRVEYHPALLSIYLFKGTGSGGPVDSAAVEATFRAQVARALENS